MNHHTVQFTNGVYDTRNHVFYATEVVEEETAAAATAEVGYDYVPLAQLSPAKVDRYKAYIASVFPDPETAEYVHDRIACTFAPDAACATILLGNGGNGKTTFLEMMQKAHGGRATCATALCFTGGRPNNRVAGNGFVYAEDFGESDDVLAIDHLAAIMMGQIVEQPLFGLPPLQRTPTASSIMIATTWLPKLPPSVRAADDLWRRMEVLPCTARFSGNHDWAVVQELLEDIYTVVAPLSFERLKNHAAELQCGGGLSREVARATTAYRNGKQQLVMA